MKSLLFLSLLAITSFNVAAQEHAKVKHLTKLITAKERHLHQIRQIAQANKPLQEVKRTRGATRLIAEAFRNFDGVSFVLGDTTQYSYLSNYGYDPTISEFEFNYFIPEFYDNNVQFYDKSKHWTDMGAGLQLADSGFATFTTNHKLATLKNEDVAGLFFSNIAFQYNSNELKTEMLDSLYFFGTGTLNKINFLHNANKKVIEIRNFEKNGGLWVLYQIDSLSYDINGNMVQSVAYIDNGGIFEKSDKTIFTYNAAGSFLTETSQTWNGVSWDNDEQTQNIYGAGPNPLSTTSFYWDAGAWVKDTKDSFQYSTYNYPVDYTSYSWDDVSNVWEKESKSIYTYNTNNQMLSNLLQTWNGSSWANTGLANYYYENYNPTAIIQTNSTVGTLKVYPNPVMDVLNLNLDLLVADEAVVMIYNLQGQILMQKTFVKMNQINEQINVADLASGNYILKIKTSHGELVHKFVK